MSRACSRVHRARTPSRRRPAHPNCADPLAGTPSSCRGYARASRRRVIEQMCHACVKRVVSLMWGRRAPRPPPTLGFSMWGLRPHAPTRSASRRGTPFLRPPFRHSGESRNPSGAEGVRRPPAGPLPGRGGAPAHAATPFRHSGESPGIHPGHRMWGCGPTPRQTPRAHAHPFPSHRAPLSVIPAKAGIHPGHRRGSGARRPTSLRGRPARPLRGAAAPHTPIPDERAARLVAHPPTLGISFMWGLRPHAPTRIAGARSYRGPPPAPSPLAGEGGGEGRSSSPVGAATPTPHPDERAARLVAHPPTLGFLSMWGLRPHAPSAGSAAGPHRRGGVWGPAPGQQPPPRPPCGRG